MPAAPWQWPWTDLTQQTVPVPADVKITTVRLRHRMFRRPRRHSHNPLTDLLQVHTHAMTPVNLLTRDFVSVCVSAATETRSQNPLLRYDEEDGTCNCSAYPSKHRGSHTDSTDSWCTESHFWRRVCAWLWFPAAQYRGTSVSPLWKMLIGWIMFLSEQFEMRDVWVFFY